MPELAEVEIVRRNLEGWWVGEAASDVELHDDDLLVRGSADAFVAALGRKALAARRRGKYLWVELEGDEVVLFHFRMTGKIVCGPNPDPDYARLAWRTSSGWLAFVDPRRLGKARWFTAEEFEAFEPIAKMGPEPYDVTPEGLRDRISARRQLKSALLDQKVVAGVGNIAISEIFWELELPPRVKGGDLDEEGWGALAEVLPRFFDDLIEAEMADEVVYMTSGSRGDNPFTIYGREGEPCPRCGTSIERTKVSGRSSYFCPRCQTVAEEGA